MARPSPDEKSQARQTDWRKLVAWLNASDHRKKIFESVARLNAFGQFPSQVKAMDRAQRQYHCDSMRSLGSQAVRELIREGFLVNKSGSPARMALYVNYDFIGVLSDWQEENGMSRLDAKTPRPRTRRPPHQAGYFFVGEKRSPTAIAKGWEWNDGHLAAKQLFDALFEIGIDPGEQEFVNVLGDDAAEAITRLRATTRQVVGMGLKASGALTAAGIPHLYITHPAARGTIRRKQTYINHVSTVLRPWEPT
jgi:hypothetical protein